MKSFVDPSRDVVPAFLGDVRPDAIAVGPDGGIVIEITLGRSEGGGHGGQKPRPEFAPAPCRAPVTAGSAQ